MTQEEKQLLLKDLCARLPYGVRVKQGDWEHTLESVNMYNGSFDSSCAIPIPYLRSMSNMTEEEDKELEETLQYTQFTLESYDWLNAHHFDYRGLIEKGLALVAPEGMYKTE